MHELIIVNYESVLVGGSSKPILINALNNEGIEKPYVMKTYKTKFIEENFSIAKEIIVTYLAKEFDLPVPEMGLISIENKDLKKFYNEDEIKSIDNGYKFCTEYQEGYVIMSTTLASKKLVNEYDIGNLFAFDNLIMNVDRGGFRNKPNLLLKDENFLLIDHEQTFPFFNSFDKKIDQNYFSIFNNFYYQNHIFWSLLKTFSTTKKQDLFNEFSEILKNLNIDKLKLIFSEMEKYGVKFGDKEIIFAYLFWAKQNYNKINNILISRLK